MNSKKIVKMVVICLMSASIGLKGAESSGDGINISYFTEPVVASFTDNWQLEYNGFVMPISYSGREDLRAMLNNSGEAVPVNAEVKLIGEIIAEEEGNAAIGVGADWWWVCSVNGEEIVGRLPTMPDGNQKRSFEKTDWIFLIPVVVGKNNVELNVVLGESGIVAIGEIDSSLTANGIPMELERSYHFYKKNFPPPESVPFKPYPKWNGIVTFRTAQPFPAGLEYKLGDGDWHVVWDKRPSRRHRVHIPVCPWLKCVYRPVQQVYYAGWHTLRGQEVEWVKEF